MPHQAADVSHVAQHGFRRALVFQLRVRILPGGCEGRACMDENPDVSAVAAQFAEPARARMLAALMGGKALPAGELAFLANVSPPTASNHLRRLLDAGLLEVERQGRHRYYRLSCAEIAAAIEALWSVLPRTRLRGDGGYRAPQDKPFRLLRRCHSHLAGSLAVSLMDTIVARGFLLPQDGRACRVTSAGARWFGELGIPARVLDGRGDRATRCLDWTERRDHLAGPLGVAFFHLLVERNWIATVRHSRAMRVTIVGHMELERRIGLTVPR
jgi:DNA-binding transcriptional ArsR family regulator